MIREEPQKDVEVNGRILDFMEYKKNKTFFTPPMKINVGSPINETFELIENLHYKGKQIIAMSREDDQKTIFIVEAKIKKGKIESISMVSNTLLEELKSVFKNLLIK